ncbi:MAG: Luciferase-like monooxygenase [Mycobacterium sp.]|nr:Luciferase-like monooxygenase [Mycobacterium sp.]
MAIRIGFGAPTSGSWATPDIITEVAQRAEVLGYASLWNFQRLLYSTGTPIGETYHSVLEPMIELGFLAACTTRIKLGVAIVNFPFTSPIQLAKQAAAIDVLSKGRLLLGLGLGWSEDEFAATGGSTERRPARAVEFVKCLDAIFTGQTEFRGEFYQVPSAEILPKPVQQPRPPILFGGNVDAALKRAGRIADGWISSSRADLTRIGESVQLVRGAAEEAGRDPAALQIVVRGLVRLGAEEGKDRKPLTGSEAQIKDDFATLESQGVDEVFVDLNFDPSIGNPAADPAESLARAHEALEAFAPAR